jgi:hypothetical protein
VGKSPKFTNDESSCAEFADPCTISDVPKSYGYLTKITKEGARRERPNFIASATTNEVQMALLGKLLEAGYSANQFQKSTSLLTSNT